MKDFVFDRQRAILYKKKTALTHNGASIMVDQSLCHENNRSVVFNYQESTGGVGRGEASLGGVGLPPRALSSCDFFSIASSLSAISFSSCSRFCFS
jgi:hypothetical protein